MFKNCVFEVSEVTVCDSEVPLVERIVYFVNNFASEFCFIVRPLVVFENRSIEVTG